MDLAPTARFLKLYIYLWGNRFIYLSPLGPLKKRHQFNIKNDIQLGKSNGSHELSLIFHGMEGGHYLSTFIALKWHRCPRLNVLFPVQGLFVTLERLVGRDLSASPSRSTEGCS